MIVINRDDLPHDASTYDYEGAQTLLSSGSICRRAKSSSCISTQWLEE